MTWLKVGLVLALVAGVVLFVTLAFRFARKHGEEKARRKQAETTADILEEQRDALSGAANDDDPNNILGGL